MTAPTYQDKGEVTQAVVRNLNLLASFTGAHYSRQEVRIDIEASPDHISPVAPGHS